MMTGCRKTPLNGRPTCHMASYEVARAKADSATNYWTSTENSSNNAWNVNFSSGNTNNNNKYNQNRVRAVAAFGKEFDVFFDTILEAYEDCLRGKRSSKQAVEYMAIAHEDLVALAVEIWTGAYKPSVSTAFIVKYPKYREVFAAHFRDRIVHHWICLRLNPLFEERFRSQGNVSHNCRVGFGTKTAVQSVAEGMASVSDHYHKPAWIFKGDLVSCFMSIDKQILWHRLSIFITRRYHGDYKDILLRLTHITVFHRPELNCILNSDPALWEEMECGKSLFRNDAGKGEPIGNLTTQLFVNFLLSFLDAYVIYLFRRRNFHYARFVDDFSIVCDDLDFLKKAIGLIELFLLHVLSLVLHKDKRYLQPVAHGVLFVGSYIKPGRIYLSNRVTGKFLMKAYGYSRKADREGLEAYDVIRIQSSLNSYFGFCKGRQTYRIRMRVMTIINILLVRHFYVMNLRKLRIRNEYKEIK